MSLVTNSPHPLEIETISLVREGDGLADRVDALICQYTPCLYNRNVRPTGPIDRIDERGPYMESYDGVAVKPEERLKVITILFDEVGGQLLRYRERVRKDTYLSVFGGRDPFKALLEFFKRFGAACEEDLESWRTGEWK